MEQSIIKRKRVVIESTDYNFDKRYNEKMSQFNDYEVVSIHVVKSEANDSLIREEYIVFYKEMPYCDNEEQL